ncbi:hypothetical protein [Actinosynnema sp.]|uniref:hypothetical protein n=1 Tax=Actinosynnema sp. TaxID=1872144 RepID=UPI003F840773
MDRLADMATDYRGMAGWTFVHAERPDGLVEVAETEPDGNWQADPASTLAAEAALDRQDPTTAREQLAAAVRADKTLLRRFVRDLCPQRQRRRATAR